MKEPEMKILVIGKNGYISSCFQTYMRKYSSIQIDVISARDGAWKDISFYGYNAIFNTTGLAHNDARKGTEEEFIALNASLPIALAQKAKKEGVPVFIHMSSMIVYGEISEIGSLQFIDYETKPKPENIYGKSKLMGEEGLLKLDDVSFRVAIIRSSLVYSENAVDNFLKLTKYATKLPFFPNIKNYRSMIYSDNLCELVKLIAENQSSGLFFPQQEQFICTSELFHDIGNAVGHRVRLIRIFNPILFAMSKYLRIIRKVFGSEAYCLDISNHFNGNYRVVNYIESINRIARAKKDK